MNRLKTLSAQLVRQGLLLWLMATAGAAVAQNVSVSGTVSDAGGMPLPGVAVMVQGTTMGTVTDYDGKYSISVDRNGRLVFSFIGFESDTVDVAGRTVIDVRLYEDMQNLSDVVVVGYGTQRKKDLTGSITSVSSDDFNGGLVSSPEQLISGKVAGVQIMQSNGSPTSGSTIRIRGGASLNASNDPLIVLDGVPLEIGGISGNSNNFMSLINPNDIESMTVLKDASSTAIYGSRASNGVIIITTKKGSQTGIKVQASTTHSIQHAHTFADMLSRDEFVRVVKAEATEARQALLGTADTDWNDEIYRLAYGTDNNVSISGSLFDVPVRLSVGYYNQDGVLDTDNAERFTGALTVTPSFFDDKLRLNINGKASLNNNRFAAAGAIWNAATWNPTLPVYSGEDKSVFGGFTETVSGGMPVNGATANPVGLLEMHGSQSTVKRLVGNFDIDYKMHFLPELRLHATLGGDYAEGEGEVYIPEVAFESYTTGGRDYKYGPQKNSNRLLTAYLNYYKYFDNINSTLDLTAGYDYQHWKSRTPQYDITNCAGEVQSTVAAADQRHVLLSYYARANFAFDERYMLTATVRRDGTSRFSDDNRWGTFPSVALAWRLSEESFLSGADFLSDFKVRLSYGVTGQQDGIGNYNYLPVYTIGQGNAQYQLGDEFVTTYRPEAYVADLKWETTESFNYGFDFGFLDNRIGGSFDFYTRKTKDLLATVPSAAGTNFDKTILTNVGNVESKGIEFSLNVTPVKTEKWNWDLSFNLTWQDTEITNLSLVSSSAVTNTLVGPSIDSYQFQVFTEGYAPYMFYLYHQLYDENGRPIEGAYADINNDGQVNTDDRYRCHSPAPDYIMGLSTSLQYGKWTLSTSLRANIGNYVYNGMQMNTGAFGTMSYNDFQLNNLSSSYLETGFQTRQHLSDYYLENASFLKMDNLTLGYNFGKVAGLFNLSATAMVQNVFTITDYSGVDPEVPEGMDNSFYPRPTIYSIGLGIEF